MSDKQKKFTPEGEMPETKYVRQTQKDIFSFWNFALWSENFLSVWHIFYLLFHVLEWKFSVCLTYSLSGIKTFWEINKICQKETESLSHRKFSLQKGKHEMPEGKYIIRSESFHFRTWNARNKICQTDTESLSCWK